MAADMPQLTPPPQADFALPDGWTVVAIAVLVYFLGTVIHEALGHGLAALLVGLHPARVTSVDLEVSFRGVALGKMRFVAAAGCIANGVAAVVAIAGWRRSRNASGATKFFWWLLATINLLIPGGYLMFGSPIGFGDWGQFELGLSPLWAWKLGLTILGLAISLLGVWWGARHLGAFLPPGPARRTATWRLVLGSYLAGGIASAAAGAMNPTSPVLIATSAAAASFGGTAWLLWIGGIAVRQRAGGSQRREILASGRWRIAGLLALVIYIAVLGPGLPR
ncbi:MAG: hypothetical protein ACRD13_09395 [Terriglobales bacterium]